MSRKEKINIIRFRLDTEIKHGMCVGVLARATGKVLQLSDEVCYELALAGLLHDIGKIELEKFVQKKGETLTIEEIKYVRTHSTLSYALLTGRGYSDFVMKSILYHHENYDGSGYPANLERDEIPLGARILRICDVFSALNSDRPYRTGFDTETAVHMMIEDAKDFDLRLFLAFLTVIHDEEVLQKIKQIQEMNAAIEEEKICH